MDNCQLPKGYKNTEVGVIPEDWDVKPLFEIGDIATGTTPPTNNKSNYGEDYFFVSPADLGKGKYIVDTEKKLSKLGFSIARKYPANSILFTCIGSTIGKAGIAKIELTSNQQINAVFPNESYSSDFLFYYLNFISPKIKMGASEQAVPMINKTEFGKTSIALPTKAEQTAIATALSDTDALINSLEKLIAKKRNIKQGAMQHLLKPKEGWEVKKLGDFLDYEQPTEYLVTDTEYNDNNQIPVLTAGKTFILGYTNEENGIFKNLPVIIFDDFTTAIKYVDFPFKAKSSAMKMLLPKNEKINLRFIYEIMLQIKYQVADHKRHWIGEYSKIEIKVPSTPEEQNEIATILSDMDTEIQALETKLEKYRKIKLGMMQNLLTGKIRLI